MLCCKWQGSMEGFLATYRNAIVLINRLHTKDIRVTVVCRYDRKV